MKRTFHALSALLVLGAVGNLAEAFQGPPPPCTGGVYKGIYVVDFCYAEDGGCAPLHPDYNYTSDCGVFCCPEAGNYYLGLGMCTPQEQNGCCFSPGTNVNDPPSCP